MEDSKLRSIAEEYYYEGLDLKEVDPNKSVINFSISYGFYRSLEDLKRANLCLEQLRSFGLSGYLLEKTKEYGIKIALFPHNLEKMVGDIFVGRRD